MTDQQLTIRQLTPHLTEDELEEVLLGLDAPDSEDHLAVCAICRGKVEDFKGSLELFNQASMAWSQAKSNSLNRDLAEHRIPFRMSVRAVWTCASVLVLLLAGLVDVGEHRQQADRTAHVAALADQPAQTADPSTSDSSEIASDNAMMQQIDAAINTPEPSPAQLYGHENTGVDQGVEHAAPVRN